MFGHQDHHDQNDHNDNGMSDQPAPVPDAVLSQHEDNAATTAPAVTNDHADGAGDYIMTDPQQPAAVTPAPEPTPAPVTPTPTTDDMSAGSNDDLLGLKQQALQQLTPLVDHLDQAPEDKFRTTMMMIQASDNQALIKTAYDAAQAIPDEKARAQALLDVVNEINYFTQHDTDAAA